MKTVPKNIELLPVEKGTLAYIVITAVYLIAFSGKSDLSWVHFCVRASAGLLIFALARAYMLNPHPVVGCVRFFLPFAMLSYWYPETYYFNDFIFSNLDQHFIAADQLLFGCQPSLEFSKHAPWAWFSELMYFGYFSYYFIVFGVALYCYIKDRKLANRAAFVFICSFYLYYLVFAVLPVVGPQFYFSPPLSEVPDGYVFCDIMRFLQDTGEKPTGAFPSSHVGITFIVVIFAYGYCRKLLKYILPLFVILVLSTVYIKAHYVVDVVGGFASAAVIYPLVNRLYEKIGV